jgi:predicted nucleic acid-binding protein
VEDLESEVTIDTDVIIDYLRRKPDPEAKRLFHAVKANKLTAHMSSITVFELCRGAILSPEPERRLEEVKVLQSYVNVLPFSGETADKASEICVSLERRGEPLEVRDLFIAASAMIRGVPLITRNVSHFKRIPEIRVITPSDLPAEKE